MNPRNGRWLVLAGLLVTTATAAAQATDEGDPQFAAWAWSAEIRLPPTRAPYYAIALPAGVLGKAQAELGDLRLADAAGTRIPFAARVLRPQSEQRETPIVRQFDAGPVEESKCYELSLELGDIGPQGHNAIDIVTPGNNFRRKVELLGSTTPHFEGARQLLDKERFVVRYDVEGTLLDIHRLHYAPNTVRFLKVRVYADPSAGERIPTIDKVTVWFAQAIAGEELTQRAELGPREATRANALMPGEFQAAGAPASAWLINLDHSEGETRDRWPCQRLTFTVDGTPVQRPFYLQIADPDRPGETVPTRPWTWRKADGKLLLDIEFAQEVRAQRLRLVIKDSANPPLELTEVRYSAPLRQVIFAAPDPAKVKLPLRLLFGNPDAAPANYDFARTLPAVLTPPPARAELGERSANPDYQPPLATLPERMPWLIYTMLGLTSLVLLGILAVLARAEMRRHDAAARPQQTPSAP